MYAVWVCQNNNVVQWTALDSPAVVFQKDMVALSRKVKTETVAY